MRIRIQTVIALLFTLLFLASVPLVLLTTAGYRINLRTRRLEQTGILVLRSAPSGADVLLDGIAQRQRTPARFTALLPREYRVTVRRDGYHPWSKSLTVASRSTTFAEHVVLFPDQLPVRSADVTATALAVGPDGTLAHDDAAAGLVEVVLRRGTGASSVATRLPATSTLALSWSPSGSLLLAAGEASSALITPAGPRTETLDLPAPLTRWAWVRGPSEALFGLAGDAAWFIAPGRAPQRMATGTAGAVWHQDGIFYVGRPEPGGLRIDTLAANGAVLRQGLLRIPGDDVRFIPSPNGLLTVVGEGKVRVFSAEGDVRLERTATGAAWRTDGPQELLFWDDLELSVMEADGSIKLLTRLGAPIRDAAWYPGGTHVLYATGDTLAAIERDDRERRLVTGLFSLPGFSAFAVDARGAAIHAIAAPAGRPGVYRYPIVVP